MHVIIVGGGIIGTSVALALSDHGISVTLAEATSELLGNASAAGFGSLTPYSDPYFRGASRRFAARSVDSYRDHWIPRLSHFLGRPIDVGDKGLLDLFSDEVTKGEGVALHHELTSAGYDSELLSREAVIDLEPSLVGQYVGALWLDEPWLDREQYFEAIHLALQDSTDVTVLFDSPVTEINSSESGLRVKIARDSATLYCDYVVLCTGVSSRYVEGVELPQLEWVRGDAMAVVSPSGRQILERHVYKKHAFITPRRDGRLFLGVTYAREARPPKVLDRLSRHQITVEQAMHLLALNCELVPAIAEFDIVGSWRGWRPQAPDRDPILGPTDDPRVLIATGFIGLGITMAPAVGDAVAAYVLKGTTDSMPVEFTPSRFRAS
ncbi:MAG: FAD-binding oxidoreductase [Actinomycetota bacterium]|nr:FAD-binding oxidoreductase [Actinomycetota bacterium]